LGVGATMKRDKLFHQAFLNELSEVIENSEFGQLMTNLNFKQILRQHKIKDGFHNLYIIGYESKQCKLGVFYEVGNVFFVALAFSLSNSWDEYKWIGLDYLISYINKEPITREIKRTPGMENIKIRLTEITEKFIPVSVQIVSLFQDGEQVSKLTELLEVYIREDTRRRYNLK
jgi:hypothetical protein